MRLGSAMCRASVGSPIAGGDLWRVLGCRSMDAMTGRMTAARKNRIHPAAGVVVLAAGSWLGVDLAAWWSGAGQALAIQQSSQSATGGAGTADAASGGTADGGGLDAAAVAAAARISGKDFSGVQLTSPVVQGPIRLAAARVRVWREAGDAGLGARSVPGSTDRLLLDGDVRVRLGSMEFQAQRAVVWIQKLPAAGGVGAAPGQNPPATYQVFAYFDRVGSPTAEAGVSLSAPRLPVRGVLVPEAGIEMRADALIEGAPTEAGVQPLIADGERELADVIRSILGLPTTKEQEAAKRAAEIEAARRARDAAGARQALPPPKPRAAGESPRRFVARRAEPDRVASAGPRERGETRTLPPVPDGPADEEGARRTPRVEPRPDRRAGAGADAGRAGPRVESGPTAGATQGAGTAQAAGGTPGTTAGAGAGAATGATASSSTPERITPAPSRPAPGNPIFAARGTITIAPGAVEFVSGTDENAVVATGGVVVQYIELEQGRTLELSAQRAVVFLDPGTLEQLGQFTAENVRGIYLEGDVLASDGRYTLRGPRIFYDIRKNKAIVLDAVFWTYDEARRLPLYVRAKTLKQESADQFKASKARLSTTAFFEPELELGVDSVTITRERRVAISNTPGSGVSGGTGAGSGSGAGGEGGGDGTGDDGEPSMRSIVDADDVTLRAMGVPFFYWPGFSGDPEQFPLKDIRVENSNGSGAALKAIWDAAALIGFKRPEDSNFDLRTDIYFDRGIGLGSRGEWAGDRSRGEYFGYILPSDSGTDVLKSGAKREADGDTRGMFVFEQRLKLDDRWSLLAEGTYISDPTFIDAFFERLGETRREFASQLALNRRDENTSLNIQAKSTFSDFLANEYLLQSPGYATSKLPEVSHYVVNKDLFAETAPGALGWNSEARIGRLELNFDEIPARDRGILGNAQGQRVFGIFPEQTIAERLRAQGYKEKAVQRFDTRQELTSQLAAGPVNITPFVVGRFTTYDTDFEKFSPDNDESTRLWGALGTKFSTNLTRIDDSVQSRLFDLNRIRHIVEPHVTLWTSGTSLDAENLPVYDDSVEGITEGSQARVGVNQVWQTKRGPKGREYTSDFFKLDTDVVFASGEGDRGSPVRRFNDARPELSESGNFFVTDAAWKVTDAFSLVGSETFDFDLGQSARTSGGAILDHGYGLATFVEARFLNSQDTTFIDVGGTYQLSSKYRVSAVASYDTNANDFQSVSSSVERQSASLVLGFDLGYNTITGETSFGFLLRPVGVRSGAGVRGIGSRDPAQQGSLFGG
jgi:hypothetical protein